MTGSKIPGNIQKKLEKMRFKKLVISESLCQTCKKPLVNRNNNYQHVRFCSDACREKRNG